MESALCLGYGPLPSLSKHIPSPVSAARVTRPHFSFTHSSLSLSKTNNSAHRWPLGHVAFSPIVCAVNRFSTNDDKIVRGKAGASIVLACVLGIIGCGCALNGKACGGPPIFPQGARPAVQSLLDYLDPCDNQEVKAVDLKKAKQVIKQQKTKTGKKTAAEQKAEQEAEKELKRVYTEVCKGNVKQLKDKCSVNGKFNVEIALVEVQLCQAKQLMKCRKSEEAEKLLKNAYTEADQRKDTMGMLNVDMALVEVLIFQGKYADAKKRNCINEKGPLDAKIPLYKTIIHAMLGETDHAKKNWEEFLDARDGPNNMMEMPRL